MIYNDIKTYLSTKISADTDITDTINIKRQYRYGTEPKPPEILLHFPDDVELATANTFEGETASTVFLQIIVMANKMKFGNQSYNQQDSCNMLSDKISLWFDKIAIKNSISKIQNVRRVQKSDAEPYEKGTVAYYSILRFELTVQK